jgi:hypothetical protein
VSIHIQSIVNTNDGMEIQYVDDAEVDVDAGVITAHHLRIAHEALGQSYVDDFEQVGLTILDVARRKRHGVADEFKARR